MVIRLTKDTSNPASHHCMASAYRFSSIAHRTPTVRETINESCKCMPDESTAMLYNHDMVEFSVLTGRHLTSVYGLNMVWLKLP